jgi:hypothetical protein
MQQQLGDEPGTLIVEVDPDLAHRSQRTTAVLANRTLNR